MEFIAHHPTSSQHLAVTSIGLTGAIFAGIIIYRLYFHPYAKYPGPLLARVTSWYSVYHAHVGDLHTDIWKCHMKYGDIVRYGPNRVLINTEEGLKGIYGHGKNVRKSKSYLRISLVPGVHPTLGTLDDQKHGKLRRILNLGLSDSHLRSLDGMLQDSAALFATRMGEAEDRFHSNANQAGESGWTEPKNTAHWSDYFTFDVMSHLVFGTSYNLLSNSEDHWIIDGVLGQMRRVSLLMQLPELEDMRLDRLMFPDARRKAFRFSMKSREIMEARRKKGNERGSEDPENTDMFTKLLSAKDPETGEGLSDRQLWAESNLLIIAGSDTSSTGMAATFFYLSRNPSAYHRVTSEVRSLLSKTDDISPSYGAKLTSCTYLRACIQEALRLSPAASGAMWREALRGGLSIPRTDIHIPAGYEVGTGIYSINHSAKYFPDPFAFRPERWISAEVGEEAVARAKAAFATFSVGPRNCVGKNLAMIEISYAMAAVIKDYDFRAANGPLARVGEGAGVFEGQYQTLWSFTSKKDGPYIQFKAVGTRL